MSGNRIMAAGKKLGIKGMWILTISIALVFLMKANNPCFASEVGIWDNDAKTWTNTFANGDPIDTGPNNNAYEPQIAVDSDGVVYAVYYQYDGSKNHIYLSRYDGTDVRIWDNDAKTWTTTFANGDPIDRGTNNNAYEPQIAVDSDGVVYAVYYQYDGSKNHIYLSRYDGTDVRIWDNDAKTWTTTFANGDPIDRGTNNNAYEPQIAVDSDGVVYAVYYQYDGSKNHIYLSRYDGTDVRIWDNDAKTWTTTFANGDPIDTGTDNGASDPQIAIDSDGVVYVVYKQFNGVNNHIYLSRYDGTDVKIWDNGNSEWTNTFVNGDPIDIETVEGNASYPQVAIDSNNRVYVTYYQSYEENTHIYLSRYDGTDVQIWDNDNSEWTDTFANGDPIDTGTDNGAYDPQIAIDSNDKAYIVYKQSNPSPLFYHIYLSRYNGEDVRIWANGGWTNTFANGIPVDPGTESCGSPQLDVDSNDKVYITYAHQGMLCLYLNRYDGTDVRIWDNSDGWITEFANGDSIDTGTGGGTSGPQIAADSDGRVYVVYKQSDGENNHIYLSRYVGPILNLYSLTMGVSPEEAGTTTPSAGSHAYDENTVVDISATANTGYRFDYWEGNVADTGSASTTVTMDGAKNIVAKFSALLSEAWVDSTKGDDANSGTEAEPFATIQKGVNLAASGATLHVAAGTYAENVTVDTSVIISGASSETTTLNAGGEDVFTINADNVTISGFTISGATNSNAAGILIKAANALITENLIKENDIGVFIDSSGNHNTIQKNTIQNNDDGLLVEGDENYIIGNKILENTGAAPSGIHLSENASGNTIQFNNIVGNSPEDSGSYGVYNANTGETVNAKNNWWGDDSGPVHSANPDGSGDTISDNVDYDPWIKTDVAGAITEEIPADTTETIEDGDLGVAVEVTTNTGGSARVTITSYTDDPAPEAGFVSGLEGTYYDLQVENPENIDEIKFKIYYSVLLSLTASDKPIYWYDGSNWILCVDQVVVPGEVTLETTTYGGYVEITITDSTSPTLSDLSGTPFALGISTEEETSTTSDGGGDRCFIATAAYGTPMAEEVKSLCRFRDDVLLKSSAGRDFVKFYYATSPPIANFIRNRPGLKAMVREALKPLVKISKEITE